MVGDREKRLRQLREAYENAILDENAYHAALAAPGVQIDTGGGFCIGDDASATGGDVVGRDKIEHYHGTVPEYGALLPVGGAAYSDHPVHYQSEATLPIAI